MSKRHFNKTLMALACCMAMYAHAEHIDPHKVIGLSDDITQKYEGKGVKLGVVDEGFFVKHPLYKGRDITPLKFTLTAPNGKTDEFDASQHNIDVSETGEQSYNKHGGSVAGTIVANAHDDVYAGGVAKGASLYLATHVPTTDNSESVFDEKDNLITTENDDVRYQRQKMATAIEQVMNHNVFAINNSWNETPISDDIADADTMYKDTLSKVGTSNVLINAINQAVAKDTLVVFAGGNEQKKQVGIFALLPRYLPHLQSHYLSVVSVDENKNLASDYSNQCGASKQWCVSAPGTLKILSLDGDVKTTPDYIVSGAEGTSLSAPVVTGVLALTKERFDYFTPTQVRDTVLTTATDLGEAGVDEVFGWGVVNVADAIKGPKSLLKDETYTLNKDDTWQNDLTAKHTLTKAGTGTLTLSGKATLGGMTVKGGELKLDHLGATADTVINQSKLAVNDLTINQRYDSTKDSTLTLLNNHAISINKGASAKLAGTLELSEALVDNHVTEGKTLATVLTLAEGASYEGGFDALKVSDKLTAKSLRQDVYFTDTGVEVKANSNKPFSDPNADDNAKQALSALSALRDTPLAYQKGFYNTWLQSAYAGNLQNLHHHIHNGIYAKSVSYLQSHSQNRLSAVKDALARHDGSNQPAIWATMTDEAYRADDKARFDGRLWGVGMSYPVGNTLMMAKLSQDTTKATDAGSLANIKTNAIAFASRLKVGQWLFDASAEYAKLNYDQTRKFDSQILAYGKTTGNSVSAQVQAGHKFAIKDWSFIPSVGIQAVRLNMNALNETGTFATQTPKFNQTNTHALVSTLVARDIAWGDWVVRPALALEYTHRLGGQDVRTDSTLAGVPMTYVAHANKHQTKATALVGLQKGAWFGDVNVTQHKLSSAKDTSVGLRMGVRF